MVAYSRGKEWVWLVGNQSLRVSSTQPLNQQVTIGSLEAQRIKNTLKNIRLSSSLYVAKLDLIMCKFFVSDKM